MSKSDAEKLREHIKKKLVELRLRSARTRSADVEDRSERNDEKD
jgi:hypothetical protein